MKIKTLNPLLVSGLLTLAAGASGQDWTILFDGKSTENFRAYKQQSFPAEGWKVEDGILKTIQGGHGGDIITKEKYENFEFELDWKVTPGANSGIMYGVQEGSGPVWYTGPEYQLLDDAKHSDGKNPKTSAGSLYALIAPNAEKMLKPVGEWNQTRIVAKGNHVEHWLNGAKIVQYEWASPEVKELIAKSKFKDLPDFMKERKGHISLQHHGDEVWFRNVRIRVLRAS